MILAITSTSLYTQNDTLSYEHKEVVEVSADRFSDFNYKYFSTQIIDTEFIKSINPMQISDVLNYATGISIRDYGGIGSLRSFSLRGQAASQSLVLIDGLRADLAQSGISNLSLIPIELVDELDITRGGLSSKYGSNAMAGIVNLKTGSLNEKQNQRNFRIDYDAFENFSASASFTQNINEIPFKTFISYNDSKANFTFKRNNNGQDLVRANNSGESISSGLITEFNLTDGIKLSPKVFFRYNNSLFPGPVLDDDIQINSGQGKDYFLSTMITGDNFISDNSKGKFGLSINYSDSYYNDKNAIQFGANGIESRFLNTGIQLRYEHFLSFQYFDLNLMGELINSNLEGDNLEPEVSGKVNRLNYALSSNIERLFENNDFDLLLSAGLRFDEISDSQNAFSPFFGLNFSPQGSNLKVFSSISRNFRIPSFNEMYYLNYGNTDLLPEISNNYDFGFSLLLLEKVLFKSSVYFINTQNQIISIPKTIFSWTAENIESVQTKGIEFEIMTEIIEGLDINFNYTLREAINKTDSEEFNKLIPYIPQEIISLNIRYSYEYLSFGANNSYQSFVYTNKSNSNALIIPNFNLLNFFTQYQFEIMNTFLTARIDIFNALDMEYQFVYKYPMPLRFIRFGIRYDA